MINSVEDIKKIFDIDIPEMIVECLNEDESKQAIISMNQEQLQQGVDSNEKRIETIASQEQNSGYPYSINTVKIRGEEGLQVHNVDLRVTGEFYDSMKVTVDNDKIIIDAEFNKANGNIMDNFDRSYSFLGLIPENLKALGEWIILGILDIKLKRRLQID